MLRSRSSSRISATTGRGRHNLEGSRVPLKRSRRKQRRSGVSGGLTARTISPFKLTATIVGIIATLVIVCIVFHAPYPEETRQTFNFDDREAFGAQENTAMKSMVIEPPPAQRTLLRFRDSPIESTRTELSFPLRYPKQTRETRKEERIGPEFFTSLTFRQVFGEEEHAASSSMPRKNETGELPSQHTWLLVNQNNTINKPGNKVGAIPKIINKIFFQKEGGFQTSHSTNMIKAHESWHQMNPGYNIRYFDLHRARKYLVQHFHPVFLRAFDCIEAFAGKSNLFRMALLYREGGWHSDWKQRCLKQNLLDELSNNTHFFAARDEGNNSSRVSQCIQNAFVGTKPRHPIIEEVLKIILENVQKSYYGDTALYNTGVCVLGRANKVYEERVRAESSVADLIKFGAFFTPELQWEGPSILTPIVSGLLSIGEEFFNLFQYPPPDFYWKGSKIVEHKCKECGTDQKWKSGNDYNVLHEKKQYYCQDASSIFHLA